jgi:hypothetical protein
LHPGVQRALRSVRDQMESFCPYEQKTRDAAIDEFREHVKVGVLMSYGSSLVESLPRVAA